MRQILSLILLLGTTLLQAQQDIRVEVYPESSRAIEGQLSLERQKYINLSASGSGIEGTIGDQEKTDYYFRDLEMTLGRALGMVYSEVRWGSPPSIFQDPKRPGYADIERLKGLVNPSNSGASEGFMDLLGPNQDVGFHDRHDSYPSFMEKYSLPNNDNAYPVNNDAASELAVALLEYNYTDWTRPAFFEPVNEPDYRYYNDSRFIEFHTSIHHRKDSAGLATQVGGPCLPVGYHFKNKWGNLGSITNFIDRTNFSLDFYSYHIYDYLHWDDKAWDFTGRVTSGLPSEGVFDAVANHTVNKFGQPFTYVTSEHGAYIWEPNNPDETETREYVENLLADKYFPGSGFEHEMDKRSISDHIAVSSQIASTLTFMNHPHIVKKAVPFILLESYDWDRYYYSTLLVANNFTQKGNWVESGLLHFFEFFQDVQGRRVLSFCDDADIQQHAFVDGNTLVLVFNNQSNVEGTLRLDIADLPGQVKDMKLRKYGRNTDFRPYLTEERILETDSIPIIGREAMVLFIEYDRAITQEEVLDEKVHYGDQVGAQFSGSRNFEIPMPGAENARYALLRVGISLPGNSAREVGLAINGTNLEVAVEDCAERLADDNDYASVRIARVDPALLQEVNQVEVTLPPGVSGGVGAVVIRAAFASEDSLEGFEFTRNQIELFTHQEDSLDIRFIPETSSERTLQWQSLDESVATVSSGGLIRGTGGGQTLIIASAKDGSLADTCEVMVNDQELVSLPDKSGWTVVWVDDEATIGGLVKELAIDEDLDTYWHTEWQGNDLKGLPHEIWVDMGDTLEFDHFLYTPRQDQWGPNGTIGDYELYFSNDTAHWGAVAKEGSFLWDTEGAEDYYKEIQNVGLGSTFSARYFRLVALTEHQNKPDVQTSAASELDISIPATGIHMSLDSVEISIGESMELELRSLPLLGHIANEQFLWYADPQASVTVDKGAIKGEAPGEAWIYASLFDGSSKDSCHVSVRAVGVEEIRISETELSLKAGETLILTAEVLPSNAYLNGFHWETDNPMLIKLERGYVTGLEEGEALVMAVSSDGVHRDTCRVQILAPLYNVEFIIKDSETGMGIPLATVHFAGADVQSNEAGLALYENIHIGYYNFQVTLEGYKKHYGNMNLVKESSVEVELERIVGLQQKGSRDLQIWPVPAKEALHARLPSPGKCRIYTTEGILRMEIPVSEGDNILDMSALQSGIYLFKFTTDSGEYSRMVPIQ